MDKDSAPTRDTFSANALIHDPLAITHLIVLAIALFVCYPAAYFLDIRGGRSSPNHNKYGLYATAGATGVALLSALVGCILQPERDQRTPVYDVLRYLVPLVILVYGGVLVLSCKHRDSHYVETETDGNGSWRAVLPRLAAKGTGVGWVLLVVVYVVYTASALLVFTESVSGSTFIPLLFGTGFTIYGTFISLRIFDMIPLSPANPPEYYESFVFSACGVACLVIIPGEFVIGSAWQALNIGLLWTSSGLLSITINIQTWMPLLHERNVTNALALALIGRAIVTVSTRDDSFNGRIVHILGFILMLGSILSAVHIVLRKSLADKPLIRHADDLAEVEHTLETCKKRHHDSTHCKYADYCSYLGGFSGAIAASMMITAGLLWISATGRWLERISFYVNGPVTYFVLTWALSTVWTVYLFAMSYIHTYLRSSANIYYERVASSDAQPAVNHQDLDLRIASITDKQTLPSMRPSEYRAKRLSLRAHSPPDTAGQYHSAQPNNMFVLLSDEPNIEFAESPVSNIADLDHLFLSNQGYDNNDDNARHGSCNSSNNHIPEPSSPPSANLEQ